MNRKEVAEESFRNKFSEIGLSARFEFLGRDWTSDHGRKVKVRCKACGNEFFTWSFHEIIRGRADRMVCPECGASSNGEELWTRTRMAKEMEEYYISGHSVRETAEKFGLSTVKVNNYVKHRQLTNGKNWREASNAENLRRSTEAEQRYAQALDEMGFIYLGGYKNKRSSLKLQCKQCGHVFVRSIDYIKDERFECPECKRIRKALIIEAQRQERERLKARQAEERKRIRKQEKQRAEAENAEALFHIMNDRSHVCVVCGKRFSKAEFMRIKGRTLVPTNPRYCSPECERKYSNKIRNSHPDRRKWRTANHRHRARKYGVPYESGITLAKLIKRDGLRCALCGGMCNLNDHSWSEYSGATYPSIDHIIPMSKGGGHTWDNVQIAHMLCNALKSDKLEATG